MFSIILPTFNREKFIKNAINSVINQSFSDWELIVVDDGSTDNTKEIVKNFRDPRIKYIYQENSERSAARNRGIKESKANWICFLDSDDVFPKNRLSVLNKEIINRKINGMYFTNIEFRSKSETKLISYSSPKLGKYLRFLFENTIGTPQVCVHRDVVSKFKFNAKLSNGEDLELWTRIQTIFPIIYLNNVPPLIANDHSERSVDIKKKNTAISRLITLHHMFSNDHPANKLNDSIKRKIFSNTQFNVAKHFMYNNRKFKACHWILKSLKTDFNNKQKKHKIFCLALLLFNNIPKEYK